MIKFFSFLRKLFPFLFIKLEIDKTTILRSISVQDIINCKKPSEAELIPRKNIRINKSKLSFYLDRDLYKNNSYSAPDVKIECLFNQYWFPDLGFLISKTGRIWRGSLLGTYADPNFLTIPNLFLFRFNSLYLKKIPLIEEPRFIASHFASHNYGHFVLDMIPIIKIACNLDLGLIAKPMNEWHYKIYQSMNIDLRKIKITSEPVFLKKVFVSSYFHNSTSTIYPSTYHKYVFSELKATVKTLKNYPKNICLLRRESKKRELTNRKELKDMLLKKNFFPVYPEDYPFKEQIAFFRNAECIVSEFGAALVNIVFCKQKTKVIEIVPQKMNDLWSRNLCALFKMNYIVVQAKVNDSKRESIEIGEKVYTNINFSYRVDIQKIKVAISNSK